MDDTNDEVIHVRCDEGLKRKVRAAAGSEDMSLSEYVRTRLPESADEDLTAGAVQS
jgi:predicted HicB family RNase H-like nuclease